MKTLAIIDLYADFVGGRAEYDAETLADLKRQVAESLNRNDINWGLYNIYVNDEAVGDEHTFEDGDIIRVMSPGIKGGF